MQRFIAQIKTIRFQQKLYWNANQFRNLASQAGELPELPSTIQLDLSNSEKDSLQDEDNSFTEFKPLTILPWTKDTVKDESIGEVFSLNDSFLSSVPSAQASPYLDHQFKLSKSPSVLYRKSTHELFTEIEKDGKKQMVDRTIVLGGKRGVGKSTLLYTAVNHFLQNDWIVFYEPQLSQWTSGIYPYASVKDSTLYDQPNLAASILKSFSELNKTQLVKIQSSKNGNLYELAQSGVKNLLKSHSILETVMEELIASEKRPPILFALDQVNALYTQTHYFDKESQPLTANRLRVVNQIHKLLDSKSLKNLSTVIAQSESHSLIRSKFLIGQIEKAKLISETDPFDLSFDRFEALENDVEGNVSLPLKLNPLQMDPFLNSIDVSVRELHHFKVPMLTTEEAKTMIFFYKTTNALHQDPVDQPYVTKQWMLSQGNALELFRAATFI